MNGSDGDLNDEELLIADVLSKFDTSRVMQDWDLSIYINL